MELLKLLSDLAMRAGQDLWVSSGLFLTANGILLVALFNGAYPAVWSTAIIGGFGFLLSLTWGVVIASARKRENLWRKMAKAAQDSLRIPSELAPWGIERFYFGVQVTRPKWLTFTADDRALLQMVDFGFYFLWAVVLIAAGGAAGLYKFP
jgi:hypothetical protein